jgi:hypothetical protein
MMSQQNLIEEVVETFAVCSDIVRKKNSDYSNGGDPFKNFKMSLQVGVDPARAILVRISDKISRISNLLDREAAVKDESIQDTLCDAINYLAILKAYIKDDNSTKQKE